MTEISQTKIYFSGTTRQYYTDPNLFGCMLTTVPESRRERKKPLKDGCRFMVDNGIFSNKWILQEWLISLILDYLPYRQNCYGVIVPDFLYYLKDGTVKGDWKKTLERFYIYQPVVKRLGFPVAFVSQDGMKLEHMPWHMLDVLFIGGSNYHKRGKEAEILALEAKRRNKWVHVGRVSSVFAMETLWGWADSYDGTTFRFAPDQKECQLIPQMEKYFSQDGSTFQYKLL